MCAFFLETFAVFILTHDSCSHYNYKIRLLESIFCFVFAFASNFHSFIHFILHCIVCIYSLPCPLSVFSSSFIFIPCLLLFGLPCLPLCIIGSIKHANFFIALNEICRTNDGSFAINLLESIPNGSRWEKRYREIPNSTNKLERKKIAFYETMTIL